MRVNIPTKKDDSIDITTIDFCEGIILTKHPYGFIKATDDDSYEFYSTSAIDPDFYEYGLLNFGEHLLRMHPDIIVEYFE